MDCALRSAPRRPARQVPVVSPPPQLGEAAEHGRHALAPCCHRGHSWRRAIILRCACPHLRLHCLHCARDRCQHGGGAGNPPFHTRHPRRALRLHGTQNSRACNTHGAQCGSTVDMHVAWWRTCFSGRRGHCTSLPTIRDARPCGRCSTSGVLRHSNRRWLSYVARFAQQGAC